MKFILRCLVLLTILCGPTGGAIAADFIGSVKTISGEAGIVRQGDRWAVKIGDHIMQGDILVTGSDSSMGVIFRDDTILSLGESSQITVSDFVFDPVHDNVSFISNMAEGSAQFITGQIAKVAPENMRVETPLATIGIRGTRFLVKVD
ncbi:MAG: FecR family protein [Desulfovibrio sp.]